MHPSKINRNLLLVILILVTLSACTSTGGPNLVPATPTATFTLTPLPTPTSTPIPLEVSVNGEGITVPEFEAELARYQQAQTTLGNTVSLETARKAVNDEFIDILLLGQGAAADGYQVDDTVLQSRIDTLANQVGGPDALKTWQTAHGYTDADFRADMRRQMAAAYMRDKIAASVPASTEQVHVKQILLYNADAANQALGYLKAGKNFNDLAAQYDPVTKGELGWFPRGYLSDQIVEDTAFALQPGQYSGIIQTQAGYDILFVVERTTARPLSPDALLALQEHALRTWLTQKRNASTVVITP